MKNKKKVLIISAVAILVIVLIAMIATSPQTKNTVNSFKQGFSQGMKDGSHTNK